MEVYRPEQLKFGTGGPPKKELMYRVEDIEVGLSGFDMLILNEDIRSIKEGIGHVGRSAVLQVLAKK